MTSNDRDDSFAGRTGSFHVILHSLGVTPLFKDSFEVVRETSLWVGVEALENETPQDLFWWKFPVAGEEEASEEDVNVNVERMLTPSLTPPSGQDDRVAIEYTQISKDMALNEKIMTEVVRQKLVFSLYSGESRSRDTDTLLGTASMTMSDLMSKVSWTNTLTFKSNGEDAIPGSAYEYNLDLTVECDSILADYVTGCRIFTLGELVIRNIPSEWLIELEEGENPVDVAADDERNQAQYSATVTFSNVTDSVGSLGKLVYAPKLVEEEIENNGQTEPSIDSDGQWSILWPDVQLVHFVDMDGVRELSEGKEKSSKRFITVKIEKTDQDPLEAWRMSTHLPLEAFLLPQKVQASITGKLITQQLPSREDLEKIVENPESEEAKEQAEAFLKDFDDFASKEALHMEALQSAASLFSMTIELNRPIVEHEPLPPKPLQKISELIPPREPHPKYPPKENVKELREELRRIIAGILLEYDKLFCENEKHIALPKEEKRKKLILHLNTEGVYHDFKEKLKKKVIHVVREKFPSAPADGGGDANASDFYSQLYLFLMEEVNVVLNQIFVGTDSVSAILLQQAKECEVTSTTPIEVLRVKAMESEANGNWERATQFHLERIAYTEEHVHSLGGYNSNVWYDFGVFNLRAYDYNKAMECFRQCLSIDSQHVPALRAYGILLCEIQQFDTAEVVLKNALESEAKNAVGSTTAVSHGLLSLYYEMSGVDRTGNLVSYELMSSKNRLATTTTTTTSGGQSRSTTPPTRASACLHVAHFLCQEVPLTQALTCALRLYERFLEPHGALPPPPERFTAKWVQAKLAARQEDYVEAERLGRQAVAIIIDLPPPIITADAGSAALAWSFLGQVQTARGQPAEAMASFTRALEFPVVKFPLTPYEDAQRLALYLQFGALYLQSAQLDAAKGVFLLACKDRPVCSTWLGVGIACTRLEQWDEAEDALSEANILDPTNAEVWGYLALVCLNVVPPREEEAMHAIDQALQHELNNAGLLREIGNAYIALDNLEAAEKLLRRSVVVQDSATTRRRLADVLSARNCADLALKEYQISLEKSDDVKERCELLEKCRQLLVTLGRSEEASEYAHMLQQQAAA